MVPAHSMKSICDSLLRSFIEEKPDRRRTTNPHIHHWMGPSVSMSEATERIYLTNKAMLVGILFAQPGHRLVQDEILPNLSYFHRRSGRNVDFFLSGYSAYGYNHSDAREVADCAGTKWWFSVEALDNVRIEVEASTRWRYSGACELLLMNARLNDKTKSVFLDFSTCIVCPLEEMVRIGAIQSIRVFFEKIFGYAEKQDPADPAWGLSDSLGLDKSKSAIKNVLLSLLPKKTGTELGKLVYFASRDISEKDR